MILSNKPISTRAMDREAMALRSRLGKRTRNAWINARYAARRTAWRKRLGFGELQ